MDHIAPPSPERPTDVMPFEAYRELCNQESEAYREVGILSNEAYAKALQDEETVFIETPEGRAPGLVLIDHVDGYEPERTKALVGKEKVYVLTVPAATLSEPVDIDDDVAVVVESAHQDEVQDQIRVETQLQIGDKPIQVHQFADPRIDEEDYKNAALSIYSGKALAVHPHEEGSNKTIKDVFRSEGRELVPESGLSIFDAQDLKDHPEVMEELWDLFKDRFQWLGDYHPISMEDTREVFDEIVYSDATFMPMRFSKGKLICAGIVMHNIEECPWIKQETFDALYAMDEGENITPMYFFGIAARGDNKAIMNMQRVVQFHCRTAEKANINYRVIFESSNMSSLYIPRATEAYINSSGTMHMPSGIEKFAQVDYWYFTAAESNTSQEAQPV